jgi:hypothetical protein
MVAAAVLCGCQAQRTVTHTESRMDFGQAWSQQVGDEKKMKEKYASGFEVKDGRAVATGDKKPPFDDKKQFATGDFATKKFGEDGKSVSKKAFNGGKSFETKAFDTGEPARETGKRSSWGRKDVGIEDEFATAEWAQAARGFDTGSSAPEQTKKFRLPGNRKGEAPISSGARHANVDTSHGTPVSQGGAGVTALSVDDVRKMLSPEAFQ